MPEDLMHPRVGLGVKTHTQRPPTVVVGAYLQGLVPPHEEADGPFLLMLQKLDVTSASFLPFWEIVL